MKRGRPLRFLGAIVGGWAVTRGALIAAPLLWVHAGRAPDVFAAIEDVFPIADVASAPVDLIRSVGAGIGAALPRIGTAIAEHTAYFGLSGQDGPMGGGLPAGMGTADALLASSLAFVHGPRTATGLDLRRFPPGTVNRAPVETVAPPEPTAHGDDGRWRGTGWLLWRRDGSDVAAPGSGQLGGSQAGVRVDHAIGRVAGGELGAYGRLSAAMDRPHGAEGAVGLAWRPDRTVPVTLAVERRQRLGEGGRDAFAAYVAGGVGPTRIGAGLELEGYGQAGFVGLNSLDGFVDGKVSVTRRLTAPGARRDVAIGASLSGGAQPGVTRVDIGPEVRVRLPVGQDRARLSAEWRERVAGDARPASGPVMTLIGEF